MCRADQNLRLTCHAILVLVLRAVNGIRSIMREHRLLVLWELVYAVDLEANGGLATERRCSTGFAGY